ncbi:hypothetical protein [Thalassobacillus sp. B23F22_16]|uniref:hypothetical protein n=1 Tax=Thalassobacillus sp. B23F22_16 TaxID=3459513 RepID=UPI00373E5099
MEAIFLTTLAVWAGAGIRKLRKQKLWKDMIVYACLWATSAAILTLYRLNIPVPNPLDGLAYIYKPLGHLWKQWFA